MESEIEPRVPNMGVVNLLREGKTFSFTDIMILWYRCQNYEILETYLDNADKNHIPIWAAEEQ
ncbi:hypothetical protein IC229_05975 [Spirosoma sp. BT702]|uniref:Uncharacterized protein n=1 Tax=Spirosoma profusum TaxID=2771354 RepID=A0A926XTN8_9BACT|nr:hypothetical protein [Spirosoma profusum]MBD2700174.1 hypothetical protein [Spirosoma profusum]